MYNGDASMRPFSVGDLLYVATVGSASATEGDTGADKGCEMLGVVSGFATDTTANQTQISRHPLSSKLKLTSTKLTVSENRLTVVNFETRIQVLFNVYGKSQRGCYASQNKISAPQAPSYKRDTTAVRRPCSRTAVDIAAVLHPVGYPSWSSSQLILLLL